MRCRLALVTPWLMLAACAPPSASSSGGSSTGTSTGESSESTGSADSSTGSPGRTTSSTGAADTTGATDESGSDTTDGEADCPCIIDEPYSGSLDPTIPWGEPPNMPTCGRMLCPPVVVVCEGACELESDIFLEFEDPSAAECALTALRDRTPGLVTWEWPDGYDSSFGYILILDDGTAIRRSWGQFKSSWGVSDAMRAEPDPPTYYDECMTAALDYDRFFCLGKSLVYGEISICDAGWVVWS